MRVSKYLQCGNFKVVHPMKYCGTPKPKKVEEGLLGQGYVLQEKFDGAFYQLIKNENGEVGLFSRHLSKTDNQYVNKIENVPHIKTWAELYLPNDTSLIGEIYIPGKQNRHVAQIMGCLPQKAIERQEKQGYVKYYCFDCVRYKGKDLTDERFLDRYEYLSYYLCDVWDEDINYIPIYTIGDIGSGIVASTWEKDHWRDHVDFREKMNEIFDHGGEGAVLKHIDSIYRPGMRTTDSASFKLKEHVDSLDFVIVDLLDPEMEYTGKEMNTWPYWAELVKTDETGKEFWKNCKGNKYYNYILDPVTYKPVTKPYYMRWKNALKIGAYNKNGELVVTGRVASGLTDKLRQELGENPTKYIGMVVEVSCMALDKKNHTLRHPVFEQFRPDKNAEDCILEEIFGK